LKIKNGGENELFASMFQDSGAGNGEDILNTLERMHKSMGKITEYSIANKRVQNIFFDNVFNPFQVYISPGGKIKINYFIVRAL